MFIPRLEQPEKGAWARFRARVYKAGPSLAPWATILAALVAVISFSLGYLQFRATQEAMRETLVLQRTNLDLQKKGLDLDRDFKAIELTAKYNDLMREAGSSRRSSRAEGEYWRDVSAIAIAESIFVLTRGDKGWTETVRWMLENHTSLLKKGLDCPTYDADFIQFVNQVVKCDVCGAEPCPP